MATLHEGIAWLAATVRDTSPKHEEYHRVRQAHLYEMAMVDGLTGLFVRRYFGHDDYNIAFLRKINVLQIGVALGGERRPTFRP